MQLRNVIFAINITMDGCCDHTKQVVDEEQLDYFTHLMREVDLQVFGRKTYLTGQPGRFQAMMQAELVNEGPVTISFAGLTQSVIIRNSWRSGHEANRCAGRGLFFSLAGAALAQSAGNASVSVRARELGMPFDGTPGPLNAITDVAGVEVGYKTLISGEGKLVIGKGPVRTGVTAICRAGRTAGRGCSRALFRQRQRRHDWDALD